MLKPCASALSLSWMSGSLRLFTLASLLSRLLRSVFSVMLLSALHFLSFSNGHVEGHVARLKFLKRQMYGRANFDLLRARVLHP